MSRDYPAGKDNAVIARALASNADFLVLDEPLVGIDRNLEIPIGFLEVYVIMKTRRF